MLHLYYEFCSIRVTLIYTQKINVFTVSMTAVISVRTEKSGKNERGGGGGGEDMLFDLIITKVSRFEDTPLLYG